MPQKNPFGNFLRLLVPVLAICVLGLSVLYSSKKDLFYDQLKFIFAGIAISFILVHFNLNKIQPLTYFIFIICIIINILPIILGPEIRGSRRWIYMGSFGIQTSEILKIGFVLFISNLVAILNVNNASIKLFSSFLLIGIAVFLVLIEPDLGSALIIFSCAVLIIIFSGLSFLKIVSFIILCLLFLIPTWAFVLKDYQKERIFSYINPALDTTGSSYNVKQAIISVGSGGLLGKGFGEGTQSQLRFLPEYHTDFIFSAFAEEWGFLFSLLLFFLYCVVFYNLLYLFKNAKSKFVSYIPIAVFFVFFVQISINLGMNIGLLPVTGVPLPFMSYGGSSMLASFILLGLAIGSQNT